MKKISVPFLGGTLGEEISMKEMIVNGIKLRLANPELGLREGMYYVSRNGDIYSMFVKRFLTPTLNDDNYFVYGK